MSLSSNENLILILNTIKLQVSRYFGIFILTFGTFGNLLDIVVLLRRNLRSNSCALLLLYSSIANFLSIIFGISSRILNAWNIDPANTITWFCKFRIFIIFSSRTIAFWLFMLATIDRWFLSSPNNLRRQMSTYKKAKWSIIIVSIFSISLYSQTFYCYEANLINVPLKCFGKSVICRLLAELTFAYISVLIPIIGMIIFSTMTILNIRHSKNRIRPVDLPRITQMSSTNVICRRLKKIDHHLLVMLLMQNLMLSLFSFPILIQTSYLTVTRNNTKSFIQQTIENFIWEFIILFGFAVNGISFYIYTISSGSIFRKELIDLMRTTYRKLKRIVHICFN